MSESKHTPGPWLLVPQSTMGFAPPRIVGANGHVVAELLDGVGQPVEANGNLATAAPDMHEALKELTECLSGSADSMANLRSAHTKALAALAKAEGRTG